MNQLNLIRYFDNGLLTQGILLINDAYFCDTLELPWKDNEHEISCIPAGMYTLKQANLPINGECYQIVDVPNRSDILIHSANLVSELRGCIAPGIKYGVEVLYSKAHLAQLINVVGNEASLEIRGI